MLIINCAYIVYGRAEIDKRCEKRLWSWDKTRLAYIDHELMLFHEGRQFMFKDQVADVLPGSVVVISHTSFEFCNDTFRDCHSVCYLSLKSENL